MWQVDVYTAVKDRRVSLAHVTLQGVAFYEEFTTKDRLEGLIRSHGRKSIYLAIDAAPDSR